MIEESSRNNNKVIFISNGSAFWTQTTMFNTFCDVNPQYFPFDSHTCFIKVSGWGTDASYVNYTENGIFREDLQNSTEWELVYSKAKSMPIIRSYTLSNVEFHFTFKRRSGYYVLTVIIPFTVVSVLGLLTFPLPPESGEKVSLGMTCLLSFFVIQASVSEHLPTSSHTMPYIGSIPNSDFLKKITSIYIVMVL